MEAAVQNQEVQTQICHQSEQKKESVKPDSSSPITSVPNTDEDSYVDCTYNPFVSPDPFTM